MIDLSKCDVRVLDSHELAVFFWQYRLNGDFKTALWEAITRADTDNLRLLSYGFPVEVEGYRKYTTINGWWQEVEKKVERKE